VDGASYCRSELTAPGGMTLDPMPGYLWFHVVTTGGALLEVDRDHARWLHPGDVALVPQANGHILRSQPGVPAPGILELEHPSDRYEILRHGGGTPTTLICGAVRFDHPVAHNLVGILPPLLYIQASDEPRASWMQGVFRLMAAEARAFRPGGEAVIARLTDVRWRHRGRAGRPPRRPVRGRLRPRVQTRDRHPSGRRQTLRAG
jgi:hypothetical protein